jgi:hypothetical protein
MDFIDPGRCRFGGLSVRNFQTLSRYVRQAQGAAKATESSASCSCHITEAAIAPRRFFKKEIAMKYAYPLTMLLCAFTLALCADAALAQQLTVNTPIARELQRDEKHTYQITLTAKQAAHVVATQQGAERCLSLWRGAQRTRPNLDG